jgi:hypothetical protein
MLSEGFIHSLPAAMGAQIGMFVGILSVGCLAIAIVTGLKARNLKIGELRNVVEYQPSPSTPEIPEPSDTLEHRAHDNTPH